MKTTAFTLAVITILIFLVSCQKPVTKEQLKVFAPTETYPEDTFLDTVSNKSALVIVAHDDDDCAMSGTIAKLTAQGWSVVQVSLESHLLAETGENPAYIICEGNEVLLEDGFYRKGLDTTQYAYLPIPLEKFEEVFLYDKVTEAILEKVQTHKPSVIFTLDDVIGGYGHPDHIFLSKLVKDLFEDGSIEIQRIYQSVFTDHMEREIVEKRLSRKMKRWGFPNATELANEMYQINGMPEPTVQINILDHAETKMKYLRAYDEDVRKNLRKFLPHYEEIDAKSYFSVFDREFFRVIER